MKHLILNQYNRLRACCCLVEASLYNAAAGIISPEAENAAPTCPWI